MTKTSIAQIAALSTVNNILIKQLINLLKDSDRIIMNRETKINDLSLSLCHHLILFFFRSNTEYIYIYKEKYFQ